MADISKVKLPGDSTARNIKDTVARAKHGAVMYTKTLSKNSWSSNTYTLALTELVCGGGSVAPIISPTSNIDDYNLIASAVATAGTGIVFTLTSGATVSADIGLQIIDFL